MQSPRRSSGFTLIELMIAMALGLVICGTAYAALRLASQSVAIVNRLSLENQVMRAGVSSALHELDTWEAYDNPATGYTPLRADGSPFAPLAFNSTNLCLDFDQSKAHTWWRGDPVKSDSRPRGDYALFAKAGHADWRHAWSDDLLMHLIDHLGYYAMMDYGPCNRFIVHRDANGNVPDEFFRCGYGPKVLYNDLGYDGFQPRDWSGAQYVIAYTLSTDPAYIAGNISRRIFPGGNNSCAIGSPWSFGDAATSCASRIDLLTQRPENWPRLDMTIRHMWTMSQSTDSGVLVLSNPLTAQEIKLYITNVATSLRGARRQRGLDSMP